MSVYASLELHAMAAALCTLRIRVHPASGWGRFGVVRSVTVTTCRLWPKRRGLLYAAGRAQLPKMVASAARKLEAALVGNGTTEYLSCEHKTTIREDGLEGFRTDDLMAHPD